MEGGALAPSRLEHAASAAAQSRSHAQAKAQGVADKTHARFSPSAANRRIHCPPSLLLEEQFEEGESVYAAEGTAGHALAEHLIRKHLKQRTTRPMSEYYKDELLEAVDEYVSFVIGEIEDARRECHNPVLLVEQRIDAFQSVQPAGRGNGNGHSKASVPVSRAGGRVGAVPSGSGDQRPGHCHRPAVGG